LLVTVLLTSVLNLLYHADEMFQIFSHFISFSWKEEIQMIKNGQTHLKKNRKNKSIVLTHFTFHLSLMSG